MPSTTLFKKWDIVLVPFPFTDLSSAKRRPALVVSPNLYNAGRDIVIAYLTSQINTSPRFRDYKLQKWKEAGLPKISMVRMKFATLDQNIVVRKLGALQHIDCEEAEKNIIAFFTT